MADYFKGLVEMLVGSAPPDGGWIEYTVIISFAFVWLRWFFVGIFQSLFWRS